MSLSVREGCFPWLTPWLTRPFPSNFKILTITREPQTAESLEPQHNERVTHRRSPQTRATQGHDAADG